jgi:hypothetical protein
LLAFGVGQPAKFACLGNWSNRSEPFSLGLMSAPLSFQPLVVVVTQPVNAASVFSPPLRVPSSFLTPFMSLVVGVSQPFSNKPEALADVRGADARSAQICRPDGVARCFHVRLYSVEPAEAVLARNLLSKDDCRTALADEPVELGPEVALIGKSGSFSGGAEGLTRAGASPDGPVVGPSCETEGIGPDADPGEEVALREFAKIVGSNIDN